MRLTGGPTWSHKMGRVGCLMWVLRRSPSHSLSLTIRMSDHPSLSEVAIPYNLEKLRGCPHPNLVPIVARVHTHFPNDPCVKVEIIAFESYHFVSVLHLESGRKLIARVKFSAASLSKTFTTSWRTNSEVATMKYIKENTTIPVPEVYLHDDDVSGEVGGSWMVAEYIPHRDASLYYRWPRMSRSQKEDACKAIAKIWHELLSLRFDAVGSLRIDEAGKIAMGPMAVPSCWASWEKPIYPAFEDCGPFSTTREWLLSLAKQDIQIKDTIDPESDAGKRSKQLMQAAINKISRSPLLSSDPRTELPITLVHVDLCASNILVSPDDPTIITAVIDWEGACTTPLWAARPNHVMGVRAVLQGHIDMWDPKLDEANINLEHLLGKLQGEIDPDDQKALDLLRANVETLKKRVAAERCVLEESIWREVGRRNPEWADAGECSKELRNLAAIARCSDMEPADIKLEQ
ncbi:kinase-like domain-containing protein [Mycena belliarum]|uniref:Kinase-like domain-containing protein n=1 Tax=Mycena belliarum TaxID=1033014 RepID=A0AAD6TS83_9AGAR|nr:kinase-like domain-containing protein [Mycena belliae]